jgi:hypothetical protein
MTQFALATRFAGTADAASYRLNGVSVITEGDALGHGVKIDAMSLASVKTCAEEYIGGLKVKIDHGDEVESICGVLRNFRIDGPQLRADLQLLRNHEASPLIMEMAEVMPESFGMSISFSGQIEEINGDMFVRCIEIYSCDIVDEPAANPNGLFKKIDNRTKVTTNMTIETPEYLELKATHGTLTERFQKLDADFAALAAEKLGLSAKLEASEKSVSDFTAKLAAANAEAVKVKAEAEVHCADFDKKVADAAQRQLASQGAAPVKLGGSASGADASSVYDEFSKADPVTARAMFSDPAKAAIIRTESARRLAEAGKK